MKKGLWICTKCAESDHLVYMQSIIKAFSIFIHSEASNDSVSGQWGPWSDCVNRQADLGLCSLNMPEDTFSYGAAHIIVTFYIWKPLSCWINYDTMPTSNFQPIRLLDPDCCYKFTDLMANSADPDQLASEEANWSGSTLFAMAGYIRVQQDKG